MRVLTGETHTNVMVMPSHVWEHHEDFFKGDVTHLEEDMVLRFLDNLFEETDADVDTLIDAGVIACSLWPDFFFDRERDITEVSYQINWDVDVEALAEMFPRKVRFKETPGAEEIVGLNWDVKLPVPEDFE